MPAYLYLYSPSDFITAPVAEQNAAAAGTPTFTLQLRPGAKGTLVLIDDDDDVFDEVDGTQSLADAIDLDGRTVAAGTSINSAYDLINTGTGHKVTSFHFGGDGFQQGAVDGIASTVRLVPGVTYTFDRERTSHQQDNDYTDFIACFASGSLIATPQGPRRVEDLRVGDLVDTLDAGAQPIAWTGARTVCGMGAFAPIRLRAGTLGLTRDLHVSPQHRMLVEGADVELMFGMDSALVAAKHLCDAVGAAPAPCPAVRYHHIMFDRHQIIWADGAATESFLPQPQGLHGLDAAAQDEVLALFPELRVMAGAGSDVLLRHPARPILTGREARALH